MLLLLGFLCSFILTALLMFLLQAKKLGRESGRSPAETARERCRRILENPALQAPHDQLR